MSQDIIAKLFNEKYLGFDSETEGLDLFTYDRLIGVSLYGQAGGVYIDIRHNPAEFGHFARCLQVYKGTLFIHNAKFDIHALATVGVTLPDTVRVHCTLVGERLIDNDRLSYGLDALAPTVNLEKSGDIKDWCLENKQWEWEYKPGRTVRSKRFNFSKAPLDLMSKYAIQDAKICYHLGLKQIAWFVKRNQDRTAVQIEDGVDYLKPLIMERKLTHVLADMERIGIRIDRRYCKEALQFERTVAEQTENKLSELCGEKFVDSNKFLAGVFSKHNYITKLTAKGNPTFTSEVLEEMDNHIARLVLEYRNAHKRSVTYFENFLALCDAEDIIHCDFRQAGTATARLSCASPNLQNLTKESGEDKPRYPIRKSFIPREGYYFASIDYNQMEYRVMLDYAVELGVIARIINHEDIHTVTAVKMGVDRKTAKTLNFMLLYGGGAGKLAKALGVPLEKAVELKKQYFAVLPGVEMLIKKIMNTAVTKKEIRNWNSRVYKFPDKNYAYKAPNYLIQGGCAEVVKEGMIRVHALLKDKKSNLLLQIHDELLIEVHESEAGIEEECKKLLENVYVYKHLPLTCGLEIYRTAWLE